MSKLLALLSALCTLAAEILHGRRKRAAAAQQAAITEAVHTGNAEEVTRIHTGLLKALLLGAGLTLGALGCTAKPEVVIVNPPMVPVRLIHDGTPGWWLSDALYEATLLKLNSHTNP